MQTYKTKSVKDSTVVNVMFQFFKCVVSTTASSDWGTRYQYGNFNKSTIKTSL